MKKTVVSIIAGVLLGVIEWQTLIINSTFGLVSWAIVGLAIGAWCERRAALINGAAYGFSLFLASEVVSTLSGYAGSNHLLDGLLISSLIVLIGAVCGLVLGLLGYLLKVVFVRLRSKSLFVARYAPVAGIVILLGSLLMVGYAWAEDLSFHMMYPREVDTTRTIPLEKSSDPKQLVIFEDERIIVSIGYDQFSSYINSGAQSSWSSRVRHYQVEIEAAFSAGIFPDEVGARSMLVVEMLKLGTASVYDKQTGRELTSIVEHYQDYVCGPLCGGGSLIFYFPDGTVLYQGVYWKY